LLALISLPVESTKNKILVFAIQLSLKLNSMPIKEEEDWQRALIACPDGNRVSQKRLKQFAFDFVDLFQCAS
jgi:hypothetical protein